MGKCDCVQDALDARSEDLGWREGSPERGIVLTLEAALGPKGHFQRGGCPWKAARCILSCVTQFSQL